MNLFNGFFNKRTLACFMLGLAFSFVIAQNENNVWINGVQIQDEFLNDTSQNKYFGANILNFNSTPFSQSYYQRSLGMTWNVVNICDKNGNLLFYSNGSKVFNAHHDLIENADSLNYSNFWDSNFDGYYGNYLIGSYNNSMIAFQDPNNENRYYLVSTVMNYNNVSQTQWLRFHKVVYSIIDMSLNNGRGKMIERQRTILGGDFSHAIAACKHANGQDWWITARGYQDTNCYYFFKLDTAGIRYDHKQCIGENYIMDFPDNLTLSYGSNYSHDGKQYAILSFKGLELFDFDRCNGLFSNPRFAAYPFNTDGEPYRAFQTAQVIFSPNNQYVYSTSAGVKGDKNVSYINQFETNATDLKASLETVAVYDGFKDHLNGDTNLVGFQTTFSTMQLAPDGKIYIGNGETARYLTVMESPNKKGVDCDVKQHSIKFQSYIGGVPYYPNYSLGADTCASSGIQSAMSSQWSVYPNPANNYLNIERPQNLNSKGDIFLYDMLGREKSLKPIRRQKNGFRLDVSELSEGIYIIQFGNQKLKIRIER